MSRPVILSRSFSSKPLMPGMLTSEMTQWQYPMSCVVRKSRAIRKRSTDSRGIEVTSPAQIAGGVVVNDRDQRGALTRLLFKRSGQWNLFAGWRPPAGKLVSFLRGEPFLSARSRELQLEPSSALPKRLVDRSAGRKARAAQRSLSTRPFFFQYARRAGSRAAECQRTFRRTGSIRKTGPQPPEATVISERHPRSLRHLLPGYAYLLLPNGIPP